jgi:hypothetical protein
VLFKELVEFYDHYKGQTNSPVFPFLSDLLTTFLTRVFFLSLGPYFILLSIDSILQQLENSFSVEKNHIKSGTSQENNVVWGD